MRFIPVMAKLNFQHHYTSHIIIQKCCSWSFRNHSNMLIGAQETFLIDTFFFTQFYW